MLTVSAPSPGVRTSTFSSRSRVSPPHVPRIRVPKRLVITTIDENLILRSKTAPGSSATHAALACTLHPTAFSSTVRHAARAVNYLSTSTPASLAQNVLRRCSLTSIRSPVPSKRPRVAVLLPTEPSSQHAAPAQDVTSVSVPKQLLLDRPESLDSHSLSRPPEWEALLYSFFLWIATLVATTCR